MARQRAPTDFRGRREDLGATRKQMAAGLGIDLDTILAVENASSHGDGHRALYAAWLTRLEALAPARRALQLEQAAAGGRFD